MRLAIIACWAILTEQLKMTWKAIRAFRFRREIHEGECIPRGYGLSYREFTRLVGVCHPLPFNCIVAFFRNLKYALLRPPQFEDYIREVVRREAKEAVEFKLWLEKKKQKLRG